MQSGPAPEKLGTADHIAILLGFTLDCTPRDLATHFQISTRHVYRLVEKTRQAMPDLVRGIERFKRFAWNAEPMVSRETQTVNLESSDDSSENDTPDELSVGCSRAGTLAAEISRLKKERKGLLIQLAAAKKRVERIQSVHEDTLSVVDALDDETCDAGHYSKDESLFNEFVELRRKNKHGRRYSEELFRFSYILLSYSPRAFHFARQRLPLPSKSRLCAKFSELIQAMRTNLTDIRYSDRILEAFAREQPAGTPIVCTLGVDAFAFRLFLRTAVSREHLKLELSPSQLRQIAPLLEDQTLVGELLEEEEDYETSVDQLTKEKLDDLFNSFNYCFIFLLQPLNSNFPCITLHLLPANSGVATGAIIDVADQLRSRCRKYNINVAYVSADGDSGWNGKFHSMFKVSQSQKFTDLEKFASQVFKKCQKKDIPLAITDLLHFVKAARGRYIDHALIMRTNDLTTCTSYNDVCRALNCEPRCLTDKSQLGRMRDFYPIELFTIRNVIILLKKKLFPDAFYFLPHAILLVVIRVPFLHLDFRMQLLSVAYGLFSHVYKDIMSMIDNDSEDCVKIPQRYRAGSDHITFAETTTLERILCTITAYASAFKSHKDNLRTDALGTHIVEQRIGQSRKGCDCRWERMLSNFAHGAIRSLFLETDEFEQYCRGRLKTGGCRLSDSADMRISEFDPSLVCRVLINSLSEAGRVPTEFDECLQQVIRWLVELDAALDARSKEIGKVWLPNPAANSSITARLLKSSLTDFGFPKQVDRG